MNRLPDPSESTYRSWSRSWAMQDHSVDHSAAARAPAAAGSTATAGPADGRHVPVDAPAHIRRCANSRGIRVTAAAPTSDPQPHTIARSGGWLYCTSRSDGDAVWLASMVVCAVSMKRRPVRATTCATPTCSTWRSDRPSERRRGRSSCRWSFRGRRVRQATDSAPTSLIPRHGPSPCRRHAG